MDFISEIFKNKFYFTAWIVCLPSIYCVYANKDIQLHKFKYDDDDWFRRYFTTTKEPDYWWKRFTTNPLDDKDVPKIEDNFATGFFAFVAMLFLGVLVFCCGIVYCIKYFEGRSRETRSSPTRLTLSSTVTNVHLPPENTRSSGLQTESPVPSASPFFSIFREATNSSNASRTDKPPGYEDVVLSDLSAPKYAEVIPQASESPPPKYGEHMKY